MEPAVLTHRHRRLFFFVGSLSDICKQLQLLARRLRYEEQQKKAPQ
jgi:hypothetical protein